ncbi:SseB family protein [Streptomyces hygroscopicus]|uniref:SseB family protein n=1 Tax=Streptomyces hygroscopicus TaxID=1912 RepID=UPI0038118A63
MPQPDFLDAADEALEAFGVLRAATEEVANVQLPAFFRGAARLEATGAAVVVFIAGHRGSARSSRSAVWRLPTVSEVCVKIALMFGGGTDQPPGRGGRETLADLVRRETTARMSEREKWAALREARLYFQRPENPGFLVSETAEGGPLVPVFTSFEGLALFAGACGWASTTAEDLVSLLPEGVRALVDPLSERPFLLDAGTLREAEDREAEGHEEGADGG